MKVVDKNKPIPVEETITIELTATELAILVADVGVTNGVSCAAEFKRNVIGVGPQVDEDDIFLGHSRLYNALIDALRSW